MDALELVSLVDRDTLSSSTAVPHQGNLNRMLIAWLALQLAGQATLPFLILTMLFHKKITKRNPTIINLCIVWTIATIPPLLLFYAGKQTDLDPSRDQMLCLAQAATFSGIAPMAATAYLAVVIHACTVVNDIINANKVRPVSFDTRTVILISSPYIAFLAFSLLVAIIGAQNPQSVHKAHFFCEVDGFHLSYPVFGYSIIVVVLTLVSQVWISIMFYRNWSAKRMGRKAQHASHVDLQLLLRMLFFTLFEVVILISVVGGMTSPHFGAADVLLATPPFAVFLVFATSPDILRAWFPCCFPRKPALTLANVSITLPVPVDVDGDTHYLRKPPMAELRDHNKYDLEMGHPVSSHHDSKMKTTMVVYPGSSAQESPIEAIRAFRSPPGLPRPTRPPKA